MNCSQSQIAASVRKFIADNCLYRDGIESLADSASLLDAGLIDSTGILELILFLEQTFAIKVADEDMVPQNLDSVRQIAAFVGRQLEEDPAEKKVCHAS